jgi:hypothetical protein
MTTVQASPSRLETDPAALRAAILRRLPNRSTASGQIRWPAVPALLDHYAQTLSAFFAGLGRAFDDDELSHLRKLLDEKLLVIASRACTADGRPQVVRYRALAHCSDAATSRAAPPTSTSRAADIRSTITHRG